VLVLLLLLLEAAVKRLQNLNPSLLRGLAPVAALLLAAQQQQQQQKRVMKQKKEKRQHHGL
jgi:hypothetical protein